MEVKTNEEERRVEETSACQFDLPIRSLAPLCAVVIPINPVSPTPSSTALPVLFLLLSLSLSALIYQNLSGSSFSTGDQTLWQGQRQQSSSHLGETSASPAGYPGDALSECEQQATIQAPDVAAGQSAVAASSVQHPKPLICWSSACHGGYGTPGSSSSSGVRIWGDGCSRCYVGSLCAFTIDVSQPATWNTTAGNALKRELMVTLAGPSLVTGYVDPHPADVGSFVVTYRVWEAGEFRVSVRSACGTLNYTAGFQKLKAHEMAAWMLSVGEGGGGEGVGGEEGGKGREIDRAKSGIGDVNSMPVGQMVKAEGERGQLVNPCVATGQRAQWLRQSDGSYKWSPFPCSPPFPPPSEWVDLLAARGIREISFVGDSHQRLLFLHIVYLVQGKVDFSKWKFHGHFNFTLESSANNSLLLNFYWVDGIYKNHEFGCMGRGRFSGRTDAWPNVSKTADVMVIDGGFWTGAFCSQPELAFASHLPSFLKWAATQAKRVVYRSITPYHSDNHCHTSTNSFLHFGNKLAAELVGRFGITFFDAWAIEAPRYRETCGSADPHYTCLGSQKGRFRKRNGKWEWQEGGRVGGVVGEAVTLAMMSFLSQEIHI